MKKRNSDENGVIISKPFRGRFHLPLQRRKRWLYLFIILAAIVALGVVGYLSYRHYHPKTAPQKPFNYFDQLNNELSDAQSSVNNAKSPQTAAEKKALADNYIALGNASLNKDKPADAIVAFKKALALSDSAKREALGGLVSAYDATNQPQEAIKSAEDLIAYLKTLPQSDSVSGRINAAQGDLDRLKSGQHL